MKKLFLLAFFLPGILFAQIQVSNIDYQLPRDDYPTKGFMKVGDEEYFIERGVEGTLVSKVEGDQLVFIHELKFRPSDSSLNYYANSDVNNNSGLIYEGSILFEIYWDYVYMVDIITGELKEIVNLIPDEIRIQRDFHHGDNFFYFRALGIGWSGNLRYDRNTGLTNILEDGGFVAGGNYYWASSDNNKLHIYDLETNQSMMHPHEFSNINSITRHDSDANSRLIIRDDEGIHLLRNDHTIHTLSCNLPSFKPISYISDSRLAYTDDVGGILVLKVIDLADCSEVYSMDFPGVPSSVEMSTFSDEQLFDEYFIFGFPNDWQGNGYYYLFDIAANEVAFLDIPIDYPYLNRSVRYDNSLYFLSSNHIHYIGSLPELYRLDLDSYQTERISNQTIFETWNIVIGESQSDKELNFFYGTEDSAGLLQIDDNQNSLDEVKEFDLLKNHGIYYSIYADIWANNKYFFSTSEAIFVTENDVTTKLLDIGPNTHGSSAYKQKGDFVYVLTGLEDGHYALKINVNDLSYSKIFLPDVTYLYYKRHTSENAIVNLSHNFYPAGSLGFFDLDSEEFITFDDLGLPQGTPELLSGNNVLYHTTSSAGYDWYMVNTVTREVILSEIESGTFPDPYPDGVGGFYLVAWKYGDNPSFMHVDDQGKLTHLIEDFNHSVFYGGDRFDGQVKSLAFDAPDGMIIVSAKDGEVRQKEIPDNGLVYYQSFYWYESDQVSFVEVRNENNEYETLMFSFETEPQSITPEGREERLVYVLEGESFSVLVYKNYLHELSFEKYDYTTGSFEQLTTLQSVRNNSISGYSKKVSDTKYLISLDDATHGSEPWIFDTSTGELEFTKDIRQGIGSSLMSDYTTNPLNGEVYFSAIKPERDRQLFKLDIELSSVEEVNETTESGLHIYPNPASSQVFLEKDFENVFLMSADGKCVAHLKSYKKGNPISVDGLVEGMYLIQALEKGNNRVDVGKFVVN